MPPLMRPKSNKVRSIVQHIVEAYKGLQEQVAQVMDMNSCAIKKYKAVKEARSKTEALLKELDMLIKEN